MPVGRHEARGLANIVFFNFKNTNPAGEKMRKYEKHTHGKIEKNVATKSRGINARESASSPCFSQQEAIRFNAAMGTVVDANRFD